MKLKWAVAAAVILALICLPSLKMATAQVAPQTTGAYRTWFVVKIVGRMGPFKSEGIHGGIDGIKFSSQINSPRDPASGLPTGRRQYFPITFTKAWGPASPQLILALTNNEVLSTVTFEFYKAPIEKLGVAIETKPSFYQSVVLTNAAVSSVRRYVDIPGGNESPETRALE
jgi:type VI secretion system Hcp family effector